jgi:flagellar motor component MotA
VVFSVLFAVLLGGLKRFRYTQHLYSLIIVVLATVTAYVLATQGIDLYVIPLLHLCNTAVTPL